MIMTWTSMEVIVVEKLFEFWICFEGKQQDLLIEQEINFLLNRSTQVSSYRLS